MKKILLVTVMCVSVLCGYAQKGEKGIGGNFSIPVFGDAGVHFKLEYMKNITDRYRIIPYVSMNEDPGFFGGVDNHIFLIQKDVCSHLNPYLNAGIGLFLINADGGDDDLYSPYLTLGAGIDYQTNEKWTWQAEIGVNMHTTSFVHAYLSVGVAYTIPERANRNTNRFIPIYIPYNIGTNVGSGAGAGTGSVNTGTTTTKTQVCSICHGTGKNPSPSTVAQYGQVRYQYCDICKKTGTPHYHKVCFKCKGKGYTNY